MSEKEKKTILDAELDDAQLEKVGGGTFIAPDCWNGYRDEKDTSHCVQIHERPQKDCAATVDDGSYCDRNDACHRNAIVYAGCYRSEMRDGDSARA